MLFTNHHIRLFNIYFLPSVLIVTTYVVFGFYYGSSDDATIEALIRGLFFSGPVSEFFAFHRMTAVFYAHLYQLFPNIPWYGLFMHAFLFLAITNYFLLIHRHLEKFTTNYAVLTPLLVIFYMVFFVDGVIFITFTKVAILLAASSLLLIIDTALKAQEAHRPPYWHLGWYLFLFILAFLTRPQSGTLCILLLLPFAILYNPSRSVLLRTVCLFFALISVVGLLKIYDYSRSTEGSRYYWSVIPYVLNIYDYQRKGKNLTGPQDSMKYRAVLSGAMGDREITNVDFLSRISNDQLIDIDRLNPVDLARAVLKVAQEISLYQLLIMLAVMIAASGVLFFYRHELPFILRINFITFSVFYWSVVLAIAVLLKIPDRVLSPLVITYVTGGVLFISASFEYLSPARSHALRRFTVSTRAITSLWIVTILVLVFGAYRKYPATKMETLDIAQIATFRKAMNREITGKILVFTFNASQGFLSHQRVLSVDHLSANNRYLVVDGTWLTLLPEYPRHLKEITGSDRLSDVFMFLLKNKEKVIFVSTPRRNQFIQEYFASIYKNEFTFETFKPTTTPVTSVVATQTDNGNPIGLYTISANLN